MLLARPSNVASVVRLLSAAEVMEPTYSERGATLGVALPVGYHHVVETTVLGRGPEIFATACTGLRHWRAHRARGVRVFPPDATLQSGTTVVVTLGPRIGAIAAPCRIVAVVDECQSFGFAYGTLPGHPEQGEESFVVIMGEDGTVRFEIRAFSRPGDSLVRLVGPFATMVQSIATRNYLASLSRFVRQTTSTHGGEGGAG